LILPRLIIITTLFEVGDFEFDIIFRTEYCYREIRVKEKADDPLLSEPRAVAKTSFFILKQMIKEVLSIP